MLLVSWIYCCRILLQILKLGFRTDGYAKPQSFLQPSSYTKGKEKKKTSKKKTLIYSLFQYDVSFYLKLAIMLS